MTGGKKTTKVLAPKIIIVVAQITERFFVLVLSCTPITEVLNALEIRNFGFQILHCHFLDLVDHDRLVL